MDPEEAEAGASRTFRTEVEDLNKKINKREHGFHRISPTEEHFSLSSIEEDLEILEDEVISVNAETAEETLIAIHKIQRKQFAKHRTSIKKHMTKTNMKCRWKKKI